MAHNQLNLAPLRRDQYRQVAEWDEQRPLGDDVDWDRYEAEMNAPQWAHFGLYDGAEFVGCISLEKIDGQMFAYHVVTARRRVDPRALARVLRRTAGDLFALGCIAMVARIPVEKRAAARLAIRCGMYEWGHTRAEWVAGPLRYFILTRKRYEHGIK